MENQLDSVTEKPTCFLRLQGLACDWSKHNKHSRNIFSVHGFLRLSVKATLVYTMHRIKRTVRGLGLFASVCHKSGFPCWIDLQLSSASVAYGMF